MTANFQPRSNWVKDKVEAIQLMQIDKTPIDLCMIQCIKRCIVVLTRTGGVSKMNWEWMRALGFQLQ